MKWTELLNTERLRRPPDKEKPALELPAFFEDQDRISFSQPFRRLQAKTQVHPLVDNDHVRTRLTHSIEVATIGYALGAKVGQELVNKYSLPGIDEHVIGLLTQAACLAHDIGNPPFGHKGEVAIREWFKNNTEKAFGISEMGKNEISDLELFEGNAQGFRILTQIENYKRNGGMQLTYATLATFMKYPWGSDYLNYSWANDVDPKKKGKFSFFQSEKEYVEEIARNVGLKKREEGYGWYRHPLAFLVEASDDICYALIDLEDGIAMGSYSTNEYIKLFKDKFIKTNTNIDEYNNKLDDDDDVQRISYIRSKGILSLVLQVAQKFLELEDDILEGKFTGSILDEIADNEIVKEAKEVACNRVFLHEKKQYIEIAAYDILGGLLSEFIDACILQPHKNKSEQLRKLMGRMKPNEIHDNTRYKKIMKIVDFISGMTDRFALGIYRQIKGMSVSTSTPLPGISN